MIQLPTIYNLDKQPPYSSYTNHTHTYHNLTHIHNHIHHHSAFPVLPVSMYMWFSCRESPLKDVPGSTQHLPSNTQNVPSSAYNDTAPSGPSTSSPVPLMRQRTHSRVDTTSFFLDFFVPENLINYLYKLEEVICCCCIWVVAPVVTKYMYACNTHRVHIVTYIHSLLNGYPTCFMDNPLYYI